MSWLQHIQTWPQAIVACVALVALTAVACALVHAVIGGKYPWDR